MSSIPHLHLLDDVSVSKQILGLQNLRKFTSRLLAACARMEAIEVWAFDDLTFNAAGEAIGVNDERGTGEERMAVLMKVQTALSSQEWIDYVEQGNFRDSVDLPTIEILSLMKMRRFLLCLYYVERVNPAYMRHLLDIVLKATQASSTSGSKPEKSTPAHIVRTRLKTLNKINITQAIFSDESVAQVRAVFAALKENK